MAAVSMLWCSFFSGLAKKVENIRKFSTFMGHKVIQESYFKSDRSSVWKCNYHHLKAPKSVR
jgi:hypothetical protein